MLELVNRKSRRSNTKIQRNYSGLRDWNTSVCSDRIRLNTSECKSYPSKLYQKYVITVNAHRP